MVNYDEQFRVVFTLHLPQDTDETDVRKVTDWIDSLDPNVGTRTSACIVLILQF